MNILKIEIYQQNYLVGYFHEIVLFIDGKNLIDIIKKIEKKYDRLIDRLIDRSIAGGYKGLILEHLDPEHFLGKAEFKYGENENKTALLDCKCGCEGCWTFAAEIVVEENTVTWKNFENVRSSEWSDNPWSYEALGFFSFDKEQYLHEINKLNDPLEINHT